ncbi:MAG: extensin family protein, partial [Methylocella sp.]
MSDALAGLAPVERDFRDLCQALKMKCAKPAPRKKTAVSKKEKAEKAVVPVPRSKPAPLAKTATAVKAVTPVEKTEPLQESAENPPVKKQASPGNETVIAKTPAVEALPVKKQPEPKKEIASVVRPQKDATKTKKTEAPQAAPETGCLAQLRNSGVKFEALSPVGNGRCRVNNPVRLHAVETPSGKIELPDSPILSCRFARQFALWLSDTGAALVSAHMDMNLAKISTGPGYECRGRNGSASAKL